MLFYSTRRRPSCLSNRFDCDPLPLCGCMRPCVLLCVWARTHRHGRASCKQPFAQHDIFTLNVNIFLRVQGFPKLGRTKKSTLASLKKADAQRAAAAINDPDNPNPR